MNQDDLRDAAIIGAVIRKVRERKAFCGETLVQKATYVLKALFDVPLKAEFRIHYYGPFSFDLRSQLMAMRGDRYVNLKPHSWGATFEPGDSLEHLTSFFPRTLARYEDAIDFVVDELSSKGVKDLEPLTTALWVTKEKPDADLESRAKRLVEIKPHVQMSAAREALETVDGWIQSAS
jgi:uncharacterized protein YwgA